MELREIIERQLTQAKANQADCAYNEDYVEAAAQTIRIEALEDVLIEFDAKHVFNGNVVNING